MKTAKRTPAPSELRAMLESMAIEKAALAQRVADLAKLRDSHADVSSDLRQSIYGYQKAEKAMKDTIGTLTRDVEDLRAQLESARTINISLRAQNEVSRARGYIAGIRDEPFEEVTHQLAPSSINCDTAAMVGGEPKSDDHWYPGAGDPRHFRRVTRENAVR